MSRSSCLRAFFGCWHALGVTAASPLILMAAADFGTTFCLHFAGGPRLRRVLNKCGCGTSCHTHQVWRRAFRALGGGRHDGGVFSLALRRALTSSAAAHISLLRRRHMYGGRGRTHRISLSILTISWHRRRWFVFIAYVMNFGAASSPVAASLIRIYLGLDITFQRDDISQ